MRLDLVRPERRLVDVHDSFLSHDVLLQPQREFNSPGLQKRWVVAVGIVLGLGGPKSDVAAVIKGGQLFTVDSHTVDLPYLLTPLLHGQVGHVSDAGEGGQVCFKPGTTDDSNRSAGFFASLQKALHVALPRPKPVKQSTHYLGSETALLGDRVCACLSLREVTQRAVRAEKHVQFVFGRGLLPGLEELNHQLF